MVGEGVMMECLSDSRVEQVLIVNRKPSGFLHPKLREIVHQDFFNLSAIESQLAGYNACFFCLGTTSIGISEAAYKKVTYDLTLNFGATLNHLNPDLTFCYVTGGSTDSSEKGKIAWARVKGATENALMALFKKAYMFRPGFMKATPGQKNVQKLYKYIAWMYPMGRALFPKGFCTLQEVGQAMINAATTGASKKVLEVKDIVELSKGKSS